MSADKTGSSVSKGHTGDQGGRPVFDNDLLLWVDKKLYHLKHSEYTAHEVPQYTDCEAREMLARGMTFGALIEANNAAAGESAGDGERACCGVCYVINLDAIKKYNSAEADQFGWQRSS